MLELTGYIGKSIIVKAIKERYKDSRVYSYGNYMIPVMENYHVDLDECTVDEFCGFVYEDISSLNGENLPVSIVVIYTNLQEEVNTIESLARILEAEQLARMVVITGR